MSNKATILGNLGSDPEVRYTANGTAVANLRIATNERYTDKSGNKRESVEWHRVVVWGKVAENCGRYLSKGRQVFIEGKLKTRAWDDRDGNKRYTTEIHTQNVMFLGNGHKQEQTCTESSVSEDAKQLFDSVDVPF